MNIFEEFLKKVNHTIRKNSKSLGLIELNNFNNVTIEIPPIEFNFDLSCNVSLVLSKLNKINSKELSEKIKKILLKEIKEFEQIEVGTRFS